MALSWCQGPGPELKEALLEYRYGSNAVSNGGTDSLQKLSGKYVNSLRDISKINQESMQLLGNRNNFRDYGE